MTFAAFSAAIRNTTTERSACCTSTVCWRAANIHHTRYIQFERLYL